MTFPRPIEGYSVVWDHVNIKTLFIDLLRTWNMHQPRILKRLGATQV